MVIVMKIARIYCRVSSEQQQLTRQEQLVEQAKKDGYHIAGIYKEKASGATSDRPELLRMIHDLQHGEVVICEKIDRLSRLPLPEAEALVNAIKSKGAKLAIPGVVDLSELADSSSGVTAIVLQSVQDLLLKIALQMARDDFETRRYRQRAGIDAAKAKGDVYRGRPIDHDMHKKIQALLAAGFSVRKTANLADCSPFSVQKVKKQMESECT
jgi:DNA invertase Pin-like site-specific DNA recombinase